jgi:hypothetical protein
VPYLLRKNKKDKHTEKKRRGGVKERYVKEERIAVDVAFLAKIATLRR